MMSFVCRATLVLALILGGALAASAQTPTPPTPTPNVSSKPVGVVKTFPTPDAAADAFADAVRKDDDRAMAALLGAKWREFVPGGRDDIDEHRKHFIASWDEAHKIVMKGDDKAMVEVGTTGFVMAVPIVKESNAWHFDIAAGAQEIAARYIGHNELVTVQTLLALCDAEREYATLDPMKTGVATYARRLISSPGKKDGLYWEAQPGEPESPLGELVAKAQPGTKEGEGYFGYHYRLLYRQGVAAPGGAYDYVVNGRMIGGFAAIAWPVTYGETGVMTFIVSHSGDVYEQDFGPDTPKQVGEISVFNPDKGWEKADTTPP
jgi:hypothetical protein